MKKIILIILCIIPTIAISATNSDLSKIQSDIKKAENEKAKLQAQNKKIESALYAKQSELVKSAEKMQGLESEKITLNKKLNKLNSEKKDITKQLAENQNNIASALAGLLYMTYTPSSIVMNTKTSDMQDSIIASELLFTVSSQFASHIKEFENKITKYDSIQEQIKSDKQKSEEVLTQYRKQQKNLKQQINERQQEHKKLSKKQAEIENNLKHLAAQAKNISELVNASKKSQPASEKYSGTSDNSFRSPAVGLLIRHFGEPSPLGIISDGWLIKTDEEAIVTAPARGKVAFADSFKRYNKILILDHGKDYYTVLAGLESLNVSVGQKITTGEPVGQMSSSSPELYLELRYQNNAINPAKKFAEPRRD